MRRRLGHHLLHLRLEVIAVVFALWVLQALAWMAMMIYVQFFDPKLGNNVLYVTQISHWALVESALTAAIGAWALLQAKHNARKLSALGEAHEQAHGTPTG